MCTALEFDKISTMDKKDFAIYAEDLKKSFGKVEAVKGVNLNLVKGKILGLLGPNGAGKTTLVRMFTTLLTPDSGEALIMGRSVTREAQAVRSIIGLSGQYASVDENLTGRENLEMVGRLYHMSRKDAAERSKELLRTLELEEFAGRTVKTYSGGQRRRLDLAASLVAHPPVLFLDEPTTGLDPRSRLGLWDVIRNLVKDGTSLLLTTQYLEEADRLADWIAVIDHGKVIEQGSASDLKSRIGVDVLQIQLTDSGKLFEVAKALMPLGTDKPKIDNEARTIKLPVPGPHIIAEAVRILDKIGVQIEDLALHRPTLDDVFLTLTGHGMEEAKNEPR